MLLDIMSHVILEDEQQQSAVQVFMRKCRLYRALSDEEVSENLKVAVVHKNLQDAELRKHLLMSAAMLGSSTKDEVINYSLAEAAARRTAPMEVDQVNLVQGKGKNEKATGKGDERRCFHCDGKGHIKSNHHQKVIDDK